MENPFEEEKQQNKRPVFLTVLCILTFIGAGFAILSELVVLFLPSSFMEGMQVQFADMLGEEKAEEMVASFVLQSRLAPYQLVLSILSLTGANKMFQLKRIGFYLYTLAQVLLVVLPGLIGGQWAILGAAFWAILFIVLYAVNLKSMK